MQATQPAVPTQEPDTILAAAMVAIEKAMAARQSRDTRKAWTAINDALSLLAR